MPTFAYHFGGEFSLKMCNSNSCAHFSLCKNTIKKYKWYQFAGEKRKRSSRFGTRFVSLTDPCAAAARGICELVNRNLCVPYSVPMAKCGTARETKKRMKSIVCASEGAMCGSRRRGQSVWNGNGDWSQMLHGVWLIKSTIKFTICLLPAPLAHKQQICEQNWLWFRQLTQHQCHALAIMFRYKTRICIFQKSWMQMHQNRSKIPNWPEPRCNNSHESLADHKQYRFGREKKRREKY